LTIDNFFAGLRPEAPKLTIPVTLTSQNTLSVQLRSAPSSQIIILIAPQ
jgi:hypothetical protein